MSKLGLLSYFTVVLVLLSINSLWSLLKAPSYLAVKTNLDIVACAPNWYPTVKFLVAFSLKSFH